MDCIIDRAGTQEKKKGKTMDPEKMTCEELAAMLTKAGAEMGADAVEVQAIADMVNEGCPMNKDGTFNFVEVSAWLVSKN